MKKSSGGGARVFADARGRVIAKHWTGEVAADTSAQITDLATLVAQRKTLDDRIAVTVQDLRRRNVSWTVIGNKLGVARAAAQKRYGDQQLFPARSSTSTTVNQPTQSDRTHKRTEQP